MGTPRKKLDNESDARSALADLDHSGLDFRAFCALRGLDGRLLRAWQRRLREPSEPTSIRLLECAVTGAPTYRIRTDRFEVEVDDGFRDDTLRRLLRIVGEAA